MSRCASCGTSNPGVDFICSHHVTSEPNWAVANRIFCDLLHRHIEPPPAHIEIGVSYEIFEMAEMFEEAS